MINIIFSECYSDSLFISFHPKMPLLARVFEMSSSAKFQCLISSLDVIYLTLQCLSVILLILSRKMSISNQIHFQSVGGCFSTKWEKVCGWNTYVQVEKLYHAVKKFALECIWIKCLRSIEVEGKIRKVSVDLNWIITEVSRFKVIFPWKVNSK